MDLAQRIRAIRQEMDLNKVQFGELLGVSHAAVGQWEDGSTKSLHPDVLFKIEDETGFSARWVHNGTLPRKSADSKAIMKTVKKLGRLDAEQLKAADGILDQILKPAGDPA